MFPVAFRSVSGNQARKVSPEREVDDRPSRQQNSLEVFHSRKIKLLEVGAAAVLLSFAVSCGGAAPPSTVASARSYSVVSEQADPAAGTLTISIKVAGPATQSNVKSIAESVIAERKSEYRHITVKSYAENATANDQPVAISRLENDSVTHSFNTRTETEKIQTH
jgi:hypothetical protein